MRQFLPTIGLAISLHAATSLAQSNLFGADPCATLVKTVCERVPKDSEYCKAIKNSVAILPAAACLAANNQHAYVLKQIADLLRPCQQLLSRLCRDLGTASDTCKMVETQGKTFPPERCVSMLEHYDDVLADLRQREAAGKPLSIEQRQALLAGRPPALGPVDAKVTVVVFSDFQCPFCARTGQAVIALRSKYGSRMRLVFRQFPLDFHQYAHQTAEAALAAHAQNKFWAFHDQVFTPAYAQMGDPLKVDDKPAPRDRLNRKGLEAIARQIGLDMARFRRALDAKQYAAEVDADKALGTAVNVTGTPQVFINGIRVENPTDLSAISAELDKQLEPAK